MACIADEHTLGTDERQLSLAEESEHLLQCLCVCVRGVHEFVFVSARRPM
jgi:hypothetical protein